MKRFLIFICLFPAIAVAVLIALISFGAGSLPDQRVVLELTGWGIAVGVIPALICAVVDLLLRRTRIPPVIGTALAGYAMATLAAATIFYRSDLGMAVAFGLIPLFAPLTPAALGIAGLYLGFGFVGGIPAALCSWLVSRDAR
jgi:hypothetical protein